VDFSQTELDVIESACRAQASAYRDLALKAERPIQRNQRNDAAEALMKIAERIQADRRASALFMRGCPNCDE
jgi:hypothetical protein